MKEEKPVMKGMPSTIQSKLSVICSFFKKLGLSWLQSFGTTHQGHTSKGPPVEPTPNIAIICPFCSKTVMIHNILKDQCPSCRQKFIGETLDAFALDEEYTLKQKHVVDTTEFHLAYVPETIPVRKFYERIEKQIKRDKLPLSCKVCMTKWEGDDYEMRPRIIVNLKEHLWSSVRILAGIDYMGGWCTFQLLLIDDPGLVKIPEKEKPPLNMPFILKLLSLTLFLGAIYQYADSFWNSVILVCIGCLTFIYALTSTASYLNKRKEFENNKANVQREFVKQMVNAQKKIERSFKDDDLRLFCTAMRSVLLGYMELLFQEGSMLVKEVEGKKGFFGS